MKVDETTKRRARVNVKLVPGISRNQADKILSKTPGLQSVIQLFPDETDEEMLSMYMLEVNPDQLDAAMKQLHENPELESAHETAQRKLIW
jgi:hypothetical protein